MVDPIAELRILIRRADRHVRRAIEHRDRATTHHREAIAYSVLAREEYVEASTLLDEAEKLHGDRHGDLS